MDLPAFIEALESDGELVFASSKSRELEATEEAEVVRGLERADSRRRLEMAGTPPVLNREQAIWAARRLYRVGQYLVFRELPAQMITEEMQDDCPGLEDVSRQYSVDLVFCWLPEMYQRAASISSEDVLTRALERLGAAYPLSAVGMKLKERSASRSQQMWSEPSLRALFLDRVIARQASDCVFSEAVRSAVMDALGERPSNWLRLQTGGDGS